MSRIVSFSADPSRFGGFGGGGGASPGTWTVRKRMGKMNLGVMVGCDDCGVNVLELGRCVSSCYSYKNRSFGKSLVSQV